MVCDALNAILQEVVDLWDVVLEKVGGGYYRARPQDMDKDL
jgi:hypothetical protein